MKPILNKSEEKECVEYIIPTAIWTIWLFLISIVASLYLNFSYKDLAYIWFFILIVIFILWIILTLKIKRKKK